MALKILLTIAVVAIAIGLLALRIIFVKGGEFRGTCANNNPYLKDQIGECPACGKKPDGTCREPGMSSV